MKSLNYLFLFLMIGLLCKLYVLDMDQDNGHPKLGVTFSSLLLQFFYQSLIGISWCLALDTEWFFVMTQLDVVCDPLSYSISCLNFFWHRGKMYCAGKLITSRSIEKSWNCFLHWKKHWKCFLYQSSVFHLWSPVSCDLTLVNLSSTIPFRGALRP